MGYFDDIVFLTARIAPRATGRLDKRFPGIYSLEFLLSGRMYFGVDGGPRRVFDRPVAVWHHPAHTYQYGPVDEDGWHHHYVTFRGERGRRIVEEGLAPLSADGFAFVRQASDFAENFRRLVAIVNEHDPRLHPRAVVLLEELVCSLAEDAARGDRATRCDEAVDGLATLIRREPCRDYDFREEARRLHVSYSYLRRLFRQRVGRPPHDFLLLCRMRHAARRLQDPGLRIKEVAFETGCADAARFSKLFKRKIGLSPRQFRTALLRSE